MKIIPASPSVLQEKSTRCLPVCPFRASQVKAQWLSSGAESHARSMWAGLQGFPHGRRPWRRSDIRCNGTYPSFCSTSCFLHCPHNNVGLFLGTCVTDQKSPVDTGCIKMCAFGYVTQQKYGDKTFSDDKCSTVRRSEKEQRALQRATPK